MITPSHIIYNWAIAKKLENTHGADSHRWYGLLIGGFLPDTPTYALFFVHTLVLGTSQRELWDTIYFDSAWTPVITLSHSFVFWPLIIALGYAFGQRLLFWIGMGSLFHSALDFFVHVNDAYRHFWPLSDWKFMSPISYWNPAYYGNIVGSVDTVVVFLLLYYLITHTKRRWVQKVIIANAVLYLAATILPFFIFGGL
ncbi:MAG: metal-dependent hydrolase [Bacteroidota bacterium]